MPAVPRAGNYFKIRNRIDSIEALTKDERDFWMKEFQNPQPDRFY